MDIANLVGHFANASVPGLGALIAAWLAWRLWRRLFRAAVACLVIGLILYLTFPAVAHRIVEHERASVIGSACDATVTALTAEFQTGTSRTC